MRERKEAGEEGKGKPGDDEAFSRKKALTQARQTGTSCPPLLPLLVIRRVIIFVQGNIKLMGKGPQPTSYGAKNVMSRKWGPNRPFRCLDTCKP